MTRLLAAAEFQSLVGTMLRLTGWPGTMRPAEWPATLTLLQVDDRERRGFEQSERKPFSLRLTGPRGSVLPEGQYNFELIDGTIVDVYISPVHTPQADRQDYQVVIA